MFLIESLRFATRRLKRSSPRLLRHSSVKSVHVAQTSQTDISPLVSIIIPTRDRLPLLRQCVESVRKQTTYARYEIVIVDNGSREPDTIEYLQTLLLSGVRVVSFDDDFNFSKMCNLGVQHSRGSLICLLNNDTVVLDSEWLSCLVQHAVSETSGVTGALLTYPSGNIQHLGIALGFTGIAGHPFRGSAMDNPALSNLLGDCFEVSAVTFACAMFSKQTFEILGGLDTSLKVGLNDVDFCLRAREMGLRNVVCTSAHLIHFESMSRKKMLSIGGFVRASLEVNALSKRHSKLIREDDFFK